jgi:hypothetical protein
VLDPRRGSTRPCTPLQHHQGPKKVLIQVVEVDLCCLTRDDFHNWCGALSLPPVVLKRCVGQLRTFSLCVMMVFCLTNAR